MSEPILIKRCSYWNSGIELRQHREAALTSEDVEALAVLAQVTRISLTNDAWHGVRDQMHITVEQAVSILDRLLAGKGTR